ncbi:MAG TPA: YihY/virulence factor BrkB family protein, partial [Chitinophagaceae bacterium]|nr:YihY/virulence factor BrkB family protein [Chitinophagaceae bacterium]
MKKTKIILNAIFELLKETFSSFSENKVMKLSASLAYYTIFSMGPLLIVIISLCGLLFSKQAVEGKLYDILKNFVGSDTAFSLQTMIERVGKDDQSFIAGIIGFVVLMLGATSIFSEIQDSINIIWGIQAKPKKNWIKYLQNRFLSFSVIVSLGFLLLITLLISSLIEMVSNNLSLYFPNTTIIVFYVINLLLTIFISTLIFGTIFKVLPDARIKWKDIFAGALVTSVLFLIGKFAISFYISHTDVGSAFGAAGSLVVLLVWAYYSSVILYLGAEFTKAYASKYGGEIHPNNYAVKVQIV